MDKVYDHKQTEGKWYSLWEKNGCFSPNIDEKKKPYTIIMPPPNANGELHVGHATFIAVEDILIRYHRMCGESTLWLPGADHAGILTQVVYERELEKQGQTRFDLGREEFFKQTYGFTMRNKKHMEAQLKALGASCDWSREKFTLNPAISKAVYTTFKKLYDDGLIYRGERIINWCSRCATALSDLEVEHEEKKGKLWFIKYPVKKSTFITVATTRPETMLGDTAVAVNPTDKRYKNLIGKIVTLPIMNRQIPIVSDEAVDPNFGTGAVKVTPAHDPTDFEIGQRNDLERVVVIGQDARMAADAGEFSGFKIAEARQKIIEKLEKQNLVEKVETYKYSISVCERCRTIVEPLVSKQWFVKISPLAKPAIDAVRRGQIKILPKRFEKTYFNWMENIRDWCISRQIWWGHRIPVWWKRPEKEIEILFETHGTTTDNEQKRASGHSDAKLSELGKKQSDELGERYNNKKIDIVYTSDLSRAYNTAKIAFAGKSIKIVSDKRLRECDYGDSTGGSSERLEHQKGARITKPFPNGESYRQTTERIRDFLINLSEKHSGKTVLIVGHRATQYGLDHLIRGLPIYEAVTAPWSWQPGWKYTLDSIFKVQDSSPGSGWHQDPDTLDTWFSSGQWPYTTLGWPKDTEDFKYFYPTSVMETGYDILFFWVARMIMLGIYATGKPPFHTVFLHGLVRDEHGKKMSKSRGNVIDPLEVAEKYGADAVRMALVFGTSAGNDINLGESKIRGMRNFTNKLWNIGRFIVEMKPEKIKPGKQTKEDEWVLDELEKTTKSVTNSIENYRFGQAAEDLYEFIWHRFADKYVEHSKSRREESQIVLEKVFEESLRLLHPFMPFITEELWQRLSDKKGSSIMISSWPKKR
jgi:valyl-tRNA synthetase